MCGFTTQGPVSAALSLTVQPLRRTEALLQEHLPISTNDELVLEMNLNILTFCLVLFPLHQISSGSHFH